MMIIYLPFCHVSEDTPPPPKNWTRCQPVSWKLSLHSSFHRQYLPPHGLFPKTEQLQWLRRELILDCCNVARVMPSSAWKETSVRRRPLDMNKTPWNYMKTFQEAIGLSFG